MGVLEECLCVLAHIKETFEVWIMSDYGVSQFWTKLYTIKYKSIMCDYGCHVELIGSLKNGEILFRDTSDVISYNSECGTSRKTEIDYIDNGGAAKYFESLVSLNSNTLVERKRKRDITYVLMTTKMLNM
ncbi:uncharacterized protein LOC113325340 [Papaver somniferum]|uniref:uncharacterized protein LOC113325340 n=1 Tax=Papaver somniferum TaxID=3469 RepID=UPI000E6F904C|nr:uncharacterized protein LOC113325340 [Papaver somniferum]